MADTFHFQVVSPERILVDDQATEAQIPAKDGFIGVLPGHAALLSELMPGGVLTYRAEGREKVFAVYGGFVQVLPDHVRVLADGAEPKEEIKLEEARERLRKANEVIQKELQSGNDTTSAAVEMARAQARLDAAL
jgi:F-type H+-transporting ATPase subunit epsilon